MDDREYSILAWNVYEYSDKIHAWLLEFISKTKPDIFFLSETKKTKDKLEKWFSDFIDYTFIINVHTPICHHGVAMLIKKGTIFSEQKVVLNIPSRGDNHSGNPTDGRVITILLENKYMVIGTYVPNSGYNRNQKNYDYRINTWDPALQNLLSEYDQQYPTIWIGDINVAPMDEDVSDPLGMSLWCGFTIKERLSLVKFLTNKWADIWRIQHPKEKTYTWRGDPPYRENYGLRLDSIIVSKRLIPNVIKTFMIEDCPLSDHIPIGCIIK